MRCENTEIEPEVDIEQNECIIRESADAAAIKEVGGARRGLQTEMENTRTQREAFIEGARWHTRDRRRQTNKMVSATQQTSTAHLG